MTSMMLWPASGCPIGGRNHICNSAAIPDQAAMFACSVGAILPMNAVPCGTQPASPAGNNPCLPKPRPSAGSHASHTQAHHPPHVIRPMTAGRARADADAAPQSPWASQASYAHLPAHERAALAAQSIPSPPQASAGPEASAPVSERASLKKGRKGLRLSWADEPVLVAVRRFYKVGPSAGCRCARSVTSYEDLHVSMTPQGVSLAAVHCMHTVVLGPRVSAIRVAVAVEQLQLTCVNSRARLLSAVPPKADLGWAAACLDRASPAPARTLHRVGAAASCRAFHLAETVPGRHARTPGPLPAACPQLPT